MSTTVFIKNVRDLLNLDAALPGILGIEICRFLKNNPKTKKLPIMILAT